MGDLTVPSIIEVREDQAVTDFGLFGFLSQVATIAQNTIRTPSMNPIQIKKSFTFPVYQSRF